MVKDARKVQGNHVRFDYPCGQCMPCRITRRQEWTFRIMLECRMTPVTYFVTLTYDNEHLPDEGVKRKDLRNFIRRLRESNEDAEFRYFGVGEYGDKTKRPHYHVLIFDQNTLQTDIGPNRFGEPTIIAGDIHRAWHPRGIVDCRALLASDDWSRVAGYVAGYVTKKLTTPKAMTGMLTGKNPEFSSMSRNPGIGLGDLEQIASALRRYAAGPKFVEETKIATNLWMMRFNGRLWPVHRLLRERLIGILGEDRRTDLSSGISQDAKALHAMLNPEAEDDVEERRHRANAMLAEKKRRRIH